VCFLRIAYDGHRWKEGTGRKGEGRQEMEQDMVPYRHLFFPLPGPAWTDDFSSKKPVLKADARTKD